MIISESSRIIHAISVNYEAHKLTPNNTMILLPLRNRPKYGSIS